MRTAVVISFLFLLASCGSTPPPEIAAGCGEAADAWGTWSVGNQSAQAAFSLGDGVDFAEGAEAELAPIAASDGGPVLCVDVDHAGVVPCGEYGTTIGGYAGVPGLDLPSDVSVGREVVAIRYRLLSESATQPSIDYEVKSSARCPRSVIDDGEDHVAQYEVGVYGGVLSELLRMDRVAAKGGASSSQCGAISSAIDAKDQWIAKVESAGPDDVEGSLEDAVAEATSEAEGGSASLQVMIDKLDSVGSVAAMESIYPRLCPA